MTTRPNSFIRSGPSVFRAAWLIKVINESITSFLRLRLQFDWNSSEAFSIHCNQRKYLTHSGFEREKHKYSMRAFNEKRIFLRPVPRYASYFSWHKCCNRCLFRGRAAQRSSLSHSCAARTRVAPKDNSGFTVARSWGCPRVYFLRMI